MTPGEMTLEHLELVQQLQEAAFERYNSAEWVMDNHLLKPENMAKYTELSYVNKKNVPAYPKSPR
jgi:hypothetical protein